MPMLLDALVALQAEDDVCVKELEKQLAKAVIDHDKVCKPLYDKRAETIGSALADDESGSGGIPNFWLDAMQRDSTLVDVLSEGDADVMAYLLDVRGTLLEGKEGFKLTFKFAPNPFFTNKLIERTDSIAIMTLDGRKVPYSVSKATEIKWLKRPDLGGKKKGKKGKKGKGGKSHDEEDEDDGGDKGSGEVVKFQYEDSIFALFSPPNLTDLYYGGKGASKGGNLQNFPIELTITNGGTHYQRIQEAMQQDRTLARHIWLDFAPRAPLYFTDRADYPSYDAPTGQGMTQAMEGRVGRVLETQQKIDMARAELADRLRSERSAYWAKNGEIMKRRRTAVEEAGADGEYFWVTCFRNLPDLWEVVNERDELALRYLRDVSWAYSEGREGRSEPCDVDPLIAPKKRAFWVALEFAENPYFSDKTLTVSAKWSKGKLEVRSTQVKWKEGMRMTVRRRDTSEVGVPSRFRPSFFLLFEASDGEKGAKPGLMDDDDKLKIASLFKNVLTARAGDIYVKDPANDGIEESDEDEDEDKVDLMEDTDEEEVVDDSDSDSSDSDDDLQAKVDKATNRRKKGAGMLERMTKGRDPCVMFVMAMIAMNIIIVPLSFLMEYL